MLGDSRQHLWSDFLAVMKGKHKIRPAGMFRNLVRTALAFNGPTGSQQRGKNDFGIDAGSLAHRDTTKTSAA